MKLFPILFILILTGCVSAPEVDRDTAEGKMVYAKWLFDQERFDEALAEAKGLRNKFPYDKLATESELLVADIHFARENYIEAQVSYQTFRELHPQHPRSEYVLYRLAVSWYKQIPSLIDRDLSQSTEALARFDELNERYPKSEYAKEIKGLKNEVRLKLAQKYNYIASFYFKQEKWNSAYLRYMTLLSRFPEFDDYEGALEKAIVCAEKMDEPTEVKRLQKKLDAMKKSKS